MEGNEKSRGGYQDTYVFPNFLKYPVVNINMNIMMRITSCVRITYTHYTYTLTVAYFSRY